MATAGFAGIQPLATPAAKKILQKLTDEDQIKEDAKHYISPGVQARARADDDATNIEAVTAAVNAALVAKIDKVDKERTPFASPFDLVRPQLQAILVKHKPDLEQAIRAIVFWKGALDKTRRFVVDPKVLARELERYLFGTIGFAVDLELLADGPTVATKGNIITKLNFGYVDFHELGDDGIPLLTHALSESKKNDPTELARLPIPTNGSSRRGSCSSASATSGRRRTSGSRSPTSRPSARFTTRRTRW